MLQTPIITTLDRRTFMGLGLAAGMMAAGQASGYEATDLATDRVDTSSAETRVDLSPAALLQNPGMNAGLLESGDLVLWFGNSDNVMRAFRLNRVGLQVWQMCNGQRGKKEVLSLAAEQFQLDASELEDFLKRLIEYRVLVLGGQIRIVEADGCLSPNAEGTVCIPLEEVSLRVYP